jgi:beta-N-acetylhexosaminidase
MSRIRPLFSLPRKGQLLGKVSVLIKRMGICIGIVFYLVAASGVFYPIQAEDHSQTTPGDNVTRAQALLDEMTPEQKVGQLFLVSINGTDVTRDSPTYNLIVNHHVGGIILRADNDNFVGAPNTIPKAAELIRALQTTVWDASQRSAITTTSQQEEIPYIPLFIGISQEGDLYPNDQILNGMTTLPSLMAIGATWNPDAAEAVGTVLGRELRAIGFNLFLGPSLDVLEVLNSTGNDLGVRTFGGDPFWVGEMGKAYIRGLHNGSRDQLAVIAKHFPGRGASDRLPEEEVATVRKSLDGLKQVELAPFFTVMTADPESNSRPEGVVVSHIRYQGLQENIREITPPVSLDAEAMRHVLTLEPAAQWFADGGLIVSDNLGSSAVRRFFDPTGQTFDSRMIARSAFLAGNDLLYVNKFIDTVDSDSYTTIVRVLEAFSQKYREDPAFAERVDQSVLRILTTKQGLYSDLRIDRVLPTQGLLTDVGRSQSVVFDVARQSVTLINPSVAELGSTFPRPPETRDQIIFFTDVVSAKQCSVCPEQWPVSAESLRNAIIRLYGPSAGGSIIQGFLSTYTFLELMTYMNNPEGLAALGANLSEAEWVVFSLTTVAPNKPESLALKRILSERPELLRDKKVIVFAFGAPYYLDATDIAKLSAYYALYSKAPPFIDMAARILFQELSPSGISPVSVPGIGYDIIQATLPDPNQVISLSLDFPLAPPVEIEENITLEPTEAPSFKVGDFIPLKTGIIIDHNGNPVPDGTVVKFIINNVGESTTSQQIETITSQGVARASYRITTSANLEIRAISEPATTSQLITLNITNGEASITTFVPTPQPTLTITPEPTITPTITPTATPELVTGYSVDFSDWFFSIILVWASAALITWFGQRKVSLRWGVRWGLMAAVGGILGFIYIKIGWFIPINRFLAGGIWGVLIATLTGILVGWGIGWAWQLRLKQHKSTRKSVKATE